MDLLDSVKARLREIRSAEKSNPILVGVSGGIDSMVLLHVLHSLQLPLYVGHVNHQLRGKDADEDEQFVIQWCDERDIPCYSTRIDVEEESRAERTSMQAAARTLRYSWLAEIAGESGADMIAVGHHADDQAETILHHLFRGSGLEGLLGMAVSRPLYDGSTLKLIRPLLHVTRSDIEDYARDQYVLWREDSSNIDPKYGRAFMRHRLLPLIKNKYGEAVVERLCNTSGVLREYQNDVLNVRLDELFVKTTIETKAGAPGLRVSALKELPDVWQGRVIIEALGRWLPRIPRSRKTASEILNLLESQAGKYLDWTTGSVWRENDALVFVLKDGPLSASTSETTKVTWNAAADTGAGLLKMDIVGTPPGDLDTRDRFSVYVDVDSIEEPLQVRRWRRGDRLAPLGMSGSKKVSDLLSERKVPLRTRSNTLVLEDQQSIIWVVGVEMANRVRVTESTESIGLISFLSE